MAIARTLTLLLILLLMPLAVATTASAAEPAHTSEAAKLLDLELLELPPGGKSPAMRRAASVQCGVSLPADKAFAFIDKQLREKGWAPVPGAQHYPGFASGYYQRDGFLVYVSASPGGELPTGLMVKHNGNVPPGKLPMPSGAAVLYEFPGVTMLKSPDPPEATAEAIRESMLAAGWVPYGGAGDSHYYRKHAVLANVTVQSAPAQGGATVISCTTELLSLELPAPDFADDLRYTDGTTALGFDCDKTAEEAAAFYRRALAADGWKATTDKPVEIDWKLVTLFRNDRQEMLTLQTHEFEGRTRVRLDHQNAAEVAMEDYQQAIEAGRIASYREGAKPVITIDLAGVLEREQPRPWAVRCRCAPGEAFATAGGLMDQLIGAGWAPATANDKRPVIRDWTLKRDELTIRVIAVDAPKRVSWTAVVGVGPTFAIAGGAQGAAP